MESIREQADRAWAGDEAASQGTGSAGRLFEVVPGIALATGFGLSIAIQTADGLVIVDTSGRNHGQRVVDAIRAWDDRPIRNVVYTHGHFDHVGGMPAFDADAEARGYPRPRVIAHANVPRRFDRYTRTAGYNRHRINARQFLAARVAIGSAPKSVSKARPASVDPDVAFEDAAGLPRRAGWPRLRAPPRASGETDDHSLGRGSPR
ncbi:MAG: hypothetical protein KatS3mg064_1724 [Tepidiforma sp.]|nr:MBL fold metallo-hydrolase [Tepidiforma sp.]GIW18567.1 MAG: hypothetical protein KatS3mg064_1724 [Tepidiforma sp.]